MSLCTGGGSIARSERKAESRRPRSAGDGVYYDWPPFSKFAELFELVVLGLLFRSMFSSRIGLSIEWELSLPLWEWTGVFIFIVFSFCYIVYKAKS